MQSFIEQSELKNKIEAKIRNAALAKSIESFTTDLHKAIANGVDGNFMFSGLSVHLSASMCALGARGNTAKKMLNTLHINEDSFSNFKNFTIDHLQGAQNIELNIANGIFVDKTMEVKQSFKDRICESFSPNITDVDFDSNPEDAVDFINQWCAEKTKNKIKKLVPEGYVNSLTRMILTNALYFKASWMYTFRSGLTTSEPFFTDVDTKVFVPTMHLQKTLLYQNLESLNAECVAIPYLNKDYVFVVIKPKAIDGLKQIEMNLHHIHLGFDGESGKNNNFEYADIDLAMPKFRIESKMNLKKPLKQMGMFRRNSDFSGISDEELCVNKVLQMGFIEVDEKGTEASVATRVELVKKCITRKKWREFKIDRPFLYKIVKTSCNLTLFSGRVVQPIC